jgi:hypothetical protein
MMAYVTALQLLIFCFGIANFLPFSPSSEQETHTFRWTTTLDLKDASCAVGLDLKKIYNYTATNDELENYRSKNDIPLVFLKSKIRCNI